MYIVQVHEQTMHINGLSWHPLVHIFLDSLIKQESSFWLFDSVVSIILRSMHKIPHHSLVPKQNLFANEWNIKVQWQTYYTTFSYWDANNSYPLLFLQKMIVTIRWKKTMMMSITIIYLTIQQYRNYDISLEWNPGISC